MTTDPNLDSRRVLISPEDLIGFEIQGRYRLSGVLGEGGMGIVYRAEQTNIQREVAIKLIKPGGIEPGKRQERFSREIGIISGLSHPNIVQVYDSGVDSRLNLQFVAMELIRGTPLSSILSTHTLSPEFALEIVYQICGALTEPHKRGIIHRDIKPENMLIAAMVDETIQVKVLDFGIARSHTGDGGRVTTTGVVLGTPRYMAPESVQAGTIDARTDLYAVGVVLYEMLSGDTPFSGATPVATMIQHVTEKAPSLSEVVPDLQHPEIGELVDELLSRDPDERPVSAQAVRRKIDEIRDIYGFGRVRIDSTKPPIEGLGDFLVPRDEAKGGRSLSGATSWDEADSYDLTRPFGEEISEPESADTMLAIPAHAQAHLSRGSMAALQREEVPETPSAERGARHFPLIIAALVALIAGGIMVMVAQGEREVELIEPVEPVKPVEIIEAKPKPPLVETPQVVVTPDAGELVDLAPEEVKVESGVKPKVAKPPVTNPEQNGTDEFQEGMDWLKNE